MPEHKLRLFFFSGLLLGIFILSVFIFLPYLVPIAIAAALAVVFYPTYEKIKQKTKARGGIAAFVTIIFAMLIALIPIALFGILVVNEAYSVYVSLSQGGSYTENPVTILRNTVGRIFPELSLDLTAYMRLGLEWIVQHLGNIFTGVAKTSFNFFLGVIAMFYFLRDGKQLVKTVTTISPLPDEHDERILKKLSITINSVIKGSLAISLIQGVIAGIGFALFGVPNPALWGGVAAIAALIPGVGTALVIAPIVVFLFITEKTAGAVGLLVWGMVAVGLIDNFLGPRLIGRGTKIHPFLILISVFGGLRFFGAAGFLLGPLVLSLLFALINIYSELVKGNE